MNKNSVMEKFTDSSVLLSKIVEEFGFHYNHIIFDTFTPFSFNILNMIYKKDKQYTFLSESVYDIVLYRILSQIKLVELTEKKIKTALQNVFKEELLFLDPTKMWNMFKEYFSNDENFYKREEFLFSYLAMYVYYTFPPSYFERYDFLNEEQLLNFYNNYYENTDVNISVGFFDKRFSASKGAKYVKRNTGGQIRKKIIDNLIKMLLQFVEGFDVPYLKTRYLDNVAMYVSKMEKEEALIVVDFNVRGFNFLDEGGNVTYNKSIYSIYDYLESENDTIVVLPYVCYNKIVYKEVHDMLSKKYKFINIESFTLHRYYESNLRVYANNKKILGGDDNCIL